MSSNSGRSGRLVRRTSSLLRRAAMGGFLAGSMFAAADVSAQIIIPPNQTGTATDTAGSSSFGVQSVTINDTGVLTLAGSGAAVVNNGLEARWYDTEFGANLLNPITNLFNSGHEGTTVLTGTLNYNGDAAFTPAVHGGFLTNLDQFSALWSGYMNVTAAGNHNFITQSDDGSVFWVDLDRDGVFQASELMVNNNGDHGDVTVTRTGINLGVGNYPIAIGFYENGGGNIIRAAIRRPTDTADQNVNPAGQAGLWSYVTNQVNNANFSTNTVAVNGNATINVELTTKAATIGALSISPGANLTTSGAIAAPSTTITGAGTVTLNPTAGPLTMGPLSTSGAAVSIVKTGSGDVRANTVTGAAIGAGSTVAVNQGTFTISANNTTSSIGSAPVTLGGGTLRLQADSAPVNNANALGERYLDGTFGDGNLTPFDPALSSNSLLVLPAVGEGALKQPLDYVGATWDTKSGLRVGVDNLAGAWFGTLTVGGPNLPAGDITFATASDDGSVLWIDTDQNGAFEEAAGNFIVSNLGGHGVERRGGSVTLAAGTYKIAMGWYEGTGGEAMQARFMPGVTGVPIGIDNLDPTVEAGYANWKIINPAAADQAGVWAFDGPAATPNFGSNPVTVAANSSINVDAQLAQLSTLTLNPGVTLTKTGGELNVTTTNTSGAGATVNVTGIMNAGTLNLPNGANLTKQGAGDLVLNAPTGGSIAAGSTLTVQAGRLVALSNGPGNALGASAVNLTGGTLQLNPGNPGTAGVSGPIVGKFYAGVTPTDALFDPGTGLDALVPTQTASTVTQINFASSAGNPWFYPNGAPVLDDLAAPVDVGIDNHASRFTGTFNLAAAGEVTFFTESDDGSVMWIDFNNDATFSPSEEVINNRGLHGMVRVTNSLTLGAGNYNFKVEHFEAGGGSGIIADAVAATNYGNNVTVTNNSTIDVAGSGIATIGTLNVLSGQTLTKNGANRLRPTTTTTNGNSTFTVNAGDIATQLVDGAGTGTLTKNGAGSLVLDRAGNDVDGTTFNVTGGFLVSSVANALTGSPAVNLSNGGALRVTHADGLAASVPVTVAGSGFVDFDAPQSGQRTISVAALGGVVGQLDNLTYGAGPNNVSLVHNSVLGPDAGETNVPTQAQLGGNRLLLGLTSNTQNVTVGGNVASADPSDIYRGVAIGQWTPAGNLAATLNSLPGQDLNIQIIPPGVTQAGNLTFKTITPTTTQFNSSTGIVNMDGQARVIIGAGGSVAGAWQVLNRTGDPNFRGANNVTLELGGGTPPGTIASNQTVNIRHGSFNLPGGGGGNTTAVSVGARVNIANGGGLVLDDNAANSPSSGNFNIFGTAGTQVLDIFGQPVDINGDGIVNASDVSDGPGAIYIQQNDQNTLGNNGFGNLNVAAGEGFLLVIDGDNFTDDPGLIPLMPRADIILDDVDRDDFQAPILLGNGRRLTTTFNNNADINNDGAIQRLAAAPGLSSVPGAKVIISAAEARTLDINDTLSDFTGVDLQIGDSAAFTTTEGTGGQSQAFDQIRLARVSVAQTGRVRLAGVLAKSITVKSGRLDLEDNQPVTLDSTGNITIEGGMVFIDDNQIHTDALTAGNFGRVGSEIVIHGGAQLRPEFQQLAGVRNVLQQIRTVGPGEAQLFIDQGGGSGGASVNLENITMGANSTLNLATYDGANVRANINATAGGATIENNSSDSNIRVNVNATGQTLTFIGSRQTRIDGAITGATAINVGSGTASGGRLMIENAAQVGATPISNASFSELSFNPGAATTIAYNSANLTNNGLLRAQSGTLDMTGQTINSTAPAPSTVAGLRHTVLPGAANLAEVINQHSEIELTPRAATTPNLEGIPPFGETNGTHVYSGEFFDADGIVAFAEHFDDTVQLKIDMNNNGVFDTNETVLNNGAFNVPTTTDGDTVAAGVQPLNVGAGDGGWHAFELRLGQGTGGAGAPGNQGGANWPFGSFGFGYNPNPPSTIPNAIQQSNYQPLVDNGSGTLLRNRFNPGGGDIQVDASTTMNLGAYRNHDSVAVSGRLNLTPNGTNAGTSTSQSLTTPDAGVIDIADNDLIVRSTLATKDAEHAAIQADIVTGQNGLDAALITKWDGPGIVSSTARTNNLGQGFDLTGIGVIRNSDLDITTGIPNSGYTTFSGQAVGPDDVLVKYTYVGDANLSGAVSFDDYVGMDNAFFELIPNLGWATGDINFDGVINFDDYSKVDQAFFFQGAPLSGEGSVSAVPEPGTWLMAALASLAGLITWFRRKK